MSRRSPGEELTTTSYALLGMLALRSWSTYELAKSMDRNLGRLWPSARSHLFSEPRRLVALGLAGAEEQTVGRRPRTVYSITERGRRVLRDWLAEPGDGPTLHFEQLLKFFFADQGSKADALAAVRRIGAWADEQLHLHEEVARGYLGGGGAFPERAGIVALVGPFLAEFAELVDGWAARAEAVVEAWPEDPRRAEPRWEAIEEFLRRADARRRALGARRAG